MDMVLPKQVQAQLDEAAAIEAAMAAEQAPPAELPKETPQAPPPAAEAPPETPPPQAPAVDTSPEKPVAPPAQDDGYKVKYDVLQGKYNAEVPRLHAELRGLKQQLQSALGQIEALSTKASEPQQTQTSLVTDKDKEDFGDDLIGFSRRVARDEAAKANAELEARIAARFAPHMARVEQVEQRQVMSAEQQFWSDVRREVPDWSVIDKSQEWFEFLDSTPPFAEDTYRDLATKAIQSGNVAKVKALVDVFKGPADAAPPPPQTNPNQELRRQVAPSSTRSSSAPAGEKQWTREDYEAAYDPRKVRTMAPDALVALQAEADRAVAEGRVRW